MVHHVTYEFGDDFNETKDSALARLHDFISRQASVFGYEWLAKLWFEDCVRPSDVSFGELVFVPVIDGFVYTEAYFHLGDHYMKANIGSFRDIVDYGEVER